MFFYLYNLFFGGCFFRSVFFVDLLFIFKGIVVVFFLFGVEGVIKVVFIVVVFVVEEEFKDLLFVLIVEVWVMWLVSVFCYV